VRKLKRFAAVCGVFGVFQRGLRGKGRLKKKTENRANALVRRSIYNNAVQPVSFQLQQFRTAAKRMKHTSIMLMILI